MFCFENCKQALEISVHLEMRYYTCSPILPKHKYYREIRTIVTCFIEMKGDETFAFQTYLEQRRFEKTHFFNNGRNCSL